MLQTALYGLRPMGFIGACRRRYGDVFTLRLAPVGELVFFCSPDAAKEVYKGDPDVLRSGEYSRSLLPDLVVSPESKAYGGPRSVLFLDGEEHMHDRRVLMPVFEASAVESYREIIQEMTLQAISGVPLGKPFPMRNVTYQISLGVMLRAVLGIPPSARLQRLTETIPRLVAFNPLLMAIPLLRHDIGPLNPVGRFRRLRSEVERLLTEEIDSRREDPTSLDANDAIARLLHSRKLNGKTPTTIEIRDELQLLVAVGVESTASALAWGVEHLIRDQDLCKRVRTDLAEEASDLPDPVVKEILRTSTVLMGTARHLTADMEIAGYRVPAGVNVRVAIPLLHSSPTVHHEPKRFQPERFPDGHASPYTWMPFGGGIRRCIGANLASQEIKVALPIILKHLDLRPCAKTTERARFRSVFVAPSQGARVRCDAFR